MVFYLEHSDESLLCGWEAKGENDSLKDTILRDRMNYTANRGL